MQGCSPRWHTCNFHLTGLYLSLKTPVSSPPDSLSFKLKKGWRVRMVPGCWLKVLAEVDHVKLLRWCSQTARTHPETLVLFNSIWVVSEAHTLLWPRESHCGWSYSPNLRMCWRPVSPHSDMLNLTKSQMPTQLMPTASPHSSADKRGNEGWI